MQLSQVQYLKENGFGGAFVWSLALDDFKGQFCGEGNYALISYLRSHLASGITLAVHNDFGGNNEVIQPKMLIIPLLIISVLQSFLLFQHQQKMS